MHRLISQTKQSAQFVPSINNNFLAKNTSRRSPFINNETLILFYFSPDTSTDLYFSWIVKIQKVKALNIYIIYLADENLALRAINCLEIALKLPHF